MLSSLSISCPPTLVFNDQLDDISADVLLLAKSYLDSKEFLRAAHLLGAHFDCLQPVRASTSAHSPASIGGRKPPVSSRASFLRWYALYLVRRGLFLAE